MQRVFWLALVSLFWTTVATAGSSSGKAPKAPDVDFSSLPKTAMATPDGYGGKPHPVVARMLTEQNAVAPGETLSVGIHLQQTPDWHTYWKSAGDVGQATYVQWTMPDGLKPGPHMFPVPIRYDDAGNISFGYDDEVLHIAEIQIPKGHAHGTYTIKAAVDWLVCKTSCIPGAVELEIPFTVAAAAAAGPYGKLFEHFRAQWPTPLSEVEGLKVRAAHDAEPIVPTQPFRTVFHISAEEGHTLKVPSADLWPTYTPITVGYDWSIDSKQVVPAKDGFYVVVDSSTYEPDPLPTGDAVGGLFQIELDGHTVRTEIVHPIPWGKEGPRRAVDAALWQELSEFLPKEKPAETEAVATTADAPPPPPPLPNTDDGEYTVASLFTNLGGSFLGGLILNIMPCVLPVLMLKLYSLVEQGGISDAEKRQAGLAYTAGILVSFWLLAGAVWMMRTVFASEVGWGFQMQSPAYVAGLATVVFLFSLSLFGVFEIPAFGEESAIEMGEKEGLAGYFFTGVFATLVATPCSAPILGAAIAFAFGAPTWMLFACFTMIGVGLAFPFLLIAFVPAMYKLLPQPGAWMDSFKQLLAFTLVATTVWLVDVLAGLIGAEGVSGYLAFLTTAALGAWIFGHWGGVAAERRAQALSALAGVAVMVFGGWSFLDLAYAEDDCDDGATVTAGLSFDEHIPWQRFSSARVDELEGRVIFADFTADWCVSCKVNEQTILETQTVRNSMSEHGVVPLVADWTRRDEEISEWLKRYDRAGVPMYLVIPPTGIKDVIVLPEVITPGMVTEAIQKAASKS